MGTNLNTNMHKAPNSIPLNTMADTFGTDIFIETASSKELELYDEAKQAHRDDYHLFCVQDKGRITFEIDFQRHEVEGAAVIYIQPNQVHRVIAVEDVNFRVLIISQDKLAPETLNTLQEIAPASPLKLGADRFAIVSDTMALCIKFFRHKHQALYHSILRESCNTLALLIASQYLAHAKPTEKLSRFEVIAKAFKSILERDFRVVKRPRDYAKKLNVSTVYLNECIKKTTGQSVSHHIQQRVILEAKRSLYHSNKSVKEIAFELGYDDYPYFSRLFTKLVGVTALSFRKKNLE
ncbi:AraC family transcriptional regulator [Olivibacter sp. XZL3]|uniref:helix-turn-helix domain-containing protein n=1 Tax=Olivibacter sp. XZL3 TaxID=1735116 RepID=UPI001F0D18C7|nr:helix-turn-helix transcriptional regulator [Olivibacter sp. XZL3]